VSNGAASLPEMRERIARYRNQADDPRQDYMIGCRILTQPFFLPDAEWIPIPQSWSPHIQQGRTYDTAEGDGRRLWELIMDRVAARAGAPITVPRYGEPILIRPRLARCGDQLGLRCVIADRHARVLASVSTPMACYSSSRQRVPYARRMPTSSAWSRNTSRIERGSDCPKRCRARFLDFRDNWQHIPRRAIGFCLQG
jgi:hypothetical protein